MAQSPHPAPPHPQRFRIEGRELGYPTAFRDGCSATGLFLVRSPAAQALLADSGFRVAEVAPRRALLALAAVHYTDTDCGAYEETTLSFFVHDATGTPAQGRLPYLSSWRALLAGRLPSYTWSLQVTTALAQQAGLRMWGFPKTLAEIDFARTGGQARFTLRMEGREVLRYAVAAVGSRRPASLTSPVYSLIEGTPHVSQLAQTYRDTGYRPGGGTLTLGDHPLAAQLRSLGLPRRPLLAAWNGHLAFRMSAPEKL